MAGGSLAVVAVFVCIRNSSEYCYSRRESHRCVDGVWKIGEKGVWERKLCTDSSRVSMEA